MYRIFEAKSGLRYPVEVFNKIWLAYPFLSTVSEAFDRLP